MIVFLYLIDYCTTGAINVYCLLLGNFCIIVYLVPNREITMMWCRVAYIYYVFIL